MCCLVDLCGIGFSLIKELHKPVMEKKSCTEWSKKVVNTRGFTVRFLTPFFIQCQKGP